jgi:hypothetical protein
MRKLLILPLMLFLAACMPVEREVKDCNLTYNDGQTRTIINVFRIQNMGDRYYVKVAEQRHGSTFEVVEYLVFDVVSHYCY